MRNLQDKRQDEGRCQADPQQSVPKRDPAAGQLVQSPQSEAGDQRGRQRNGDSHFGPTPLVSEPEGHLRSQRPEPQTVEQHTDEARPRMADAKLLFQQPVDREGEACRDTVPPRVRFPNSCAHAPSAGRDHMARAATRRKMRRVIGVGPGGEGKPAGRSQYTAQLTWAASSRLTEFTNRVNQGILG